MPPLNESASNPSKQLVKSAMSIARAVEIFSWVLLVGCLFAGIVLMQYDTDSFSDNSRASSIVLGLTVMVVGSFQSLVIAMTASYIRARLASQAN